MIVWKPLVDECLQCVKEPNNKVGKNAIFLVRTNSHYKREVIVHVQQKFPLLYPYFYGCPIALWTSLQLEIMSATEMNTDWESIFMEILGIHFYVLEKAIKLKSKITKIKGNLNESVKHCQK